MKLPSPQEVLQRSVHIKMHPRPRSLMESREVLRALEQFGTIASFYHLKVPTHTFLPFLTISVGLTVVKLSHPLTCAPSYVSHSTTPSPPRTLP